MHEQLAIPESDCTLDRVFTFLQDLSHDHFVKARHHGLQFWCGTVGPYDVQFLPAGMALAERVVGSVDSHGLRSSLCTSDSCTKDSLEFMAKTFLLKKKEIAHIRLILDMFSEPGAAPPAVRGSAPMGAKAQNLADETKAEEDAAAAEAEARRPADVNRVQVEEAQKLAEAMEAQEAAQKLAAEMQAQEEAAQKQAAEKQAQEEAAQKLAAEKKAQEEKDAAAAAAVGVQQEGTKRANNALTGLKPPSDGVGPAPKKKIRSR